MNSLTETKEFDQLKITKTAYNESKKAIHTDKNAHKTDMYILWIQPSPETMPGLWKEMYRLQQNLPLQRDV